MPEKNKRPIYVLDTNVLLYNPRAIFAFPDADVVVPDAVLAELDKVKTSRADRELRYRSREISRILFDLSERGKLAEGIPFGRDSVVKVVRFDPNRQTLESLSSKSSDDRILSIIQQIRDENPDRPVSIVTNDLNMLLKAQTYNIPVERPGEEFAYGPIRRSFAWAKAQRRLVSATAAFVIFVAALIASPTLVERFSPAQSQAPLAPPELRETLEVYKAQEFSYLAMLDRNPKDLQALIGLGGIYRDRGEIYREPRYYQQAIVYYERALKVDPKNSNVRTEMAIEYLKLGMPDVAVRELSRTLKIDPNHAKAHYMLATVLFDNEGDLRGALEHFKKFVQLVPEGPNTLQAKSAIQTIEARLKQEPSTRAGS